MTGVEDGGVVLGSPALPKGEFLRSVAAQRRLPELQQKLRELEKRLAQLEKEKQP